MWQRVAGLAVDAYLAVKADSGANDAVIHRRGFADECYRRLQAHCPGRQHCTRRPAGRALACIHPPATNLHTYKLATGNTYGMPICVTRRLPRAQDCAGGGGVGKGGGARPTSHSQALSIALAELQPLHFACLTTAEPLGAARDVHLDAALRSVRTVGTRRDRVARVEQGWPERSLAKHTKQAKVTSAQLVLEVMNDHSADCTSSRRTSTALPPSRTRRLRSSRWTGSTHCVWLSETAPATTSHVSMLRADVTGIRFRCRQELQVFLWTRAGSDRQQAESTRTTSFTDSSSDCQQSVPARAVGTTKFHSLLAVTSVFVPYTVYYVFF